MKQLTRRVLFVSGLSALAVSGPLLELYGRNPEVFVINRASPAMIVAFGLFVALLVPALAWVLLWSAEQFSERAGDVMYSLLVAVLSVLTGLVVARQVAPDNMVVTLVVVVAVCSLVVLCHKWAGGYLAWAAVSLPVVLIVFFVASPVSAMIWSEPERADSATGVQNPANVVFVQLDELPVASLLDARGEINEELFPNFARLAGSGTWYRNALADSIATSLSIPAILTGNRGERGLGPNMLDYPDNMFTLLGPHYEMHVIEWVARMCPEDLCPDFLGVAPATLTSMLVDASVVYLHLIAPEPVRESLPSIDNSWSGFLGNQPVVAEGGTEIAGLPVPEEGTRARWIDWIERISEGVRHHRGGPLLSYVHIPAPHVPWVTNPSGTHYVRPEQYSEVEGLGGDGRWVVNPGPPLLGYQRHLYQLGLVDVMLGRLFDSLDATGVWDNTMIVVVADHGASFVPGEHRRWPYENNRDDLYRVPLFVKYPGQTGGETIDEPVFGIDLLPTLVDVLEVDTDWSFDGISLRDVSGVKRVHEPIWWCCSRDGVDADLAALRAQVERNHGWVPDQSSWMAIANAGIHPPLVGTPVDDLAVAVDPTVQWDLDLGVDLTEDERQPGMIQTYISGRIRLAPEIDASEVAVVVNGRIAGTGWLIRDRADGGRFAALISEELVTEGPNQIDILVIRSGGMFLSGSTADLSMTLLTDDGRELQIEPEGARRLQVDRITLVEDVDPGASNQWSLIGWSADVVDKEVPDMLYVFVGEDLITSTPPNRDNRNVVTWFDSEDLLRSGFELVFPVSSIPAGVAEVTVVAEFGDHAVAEQVYLVP